MTENTNGIGSKFNCIKYWIQVVSCVACRKLRIHDCRTLIFDYYCWQLQCVYGSVSIGKLIGFQVHREIQHWHDIQKRNERVASTVLWGGTFDVLLYFIPFSTLLFYVHQVVTVAFIRYSVTVWLLMLFAIELCVCVYSWTVARALYMNKMRTKMHDRASKWSIGKVPGK